MIQTIHDTCCEFCHISFYIIWLCEKLRITIIQIRGNYFIDIFFLIEFVEFFKSIGEETECRADKYSSGLAILQLFRNIQHTFSGRNHIVNNYYVFAFYRGAKEFMSHNRVLSIDDDRVVTSFVEHSHIDTQNR